MNIYGRYTATNDPDYHYVWRFVADAQIGANTSSGTTLFMYVGGDKQERGPVALRPTMKEY